MNPPEGLAKPGCPGGRNRPLRVVYGRLMQETNALSPVLTTREDFARTHLVDGAELERRVTHQLVPEVPGFARNAELSGFQRGIAAMARARRLEVTTVPLYSAWAVSGGPLARPTIDGFVADMVKGLSDAARVGPIDGVYLALHGAMGADGEAEPEARLIREVRAVVGDAPVACSFDLHALLTRDKMAQIDLLAGYHTNPHRDHARTGERAGRMLLERLAGQRMTTAWRSLPVVLGGGAGVDFLPPLRAVFRHLARLGHDARVVDASVFPSHPWNDHPELGWGVWVGTRDDRALADRLADDLAERLWQARTTPLPTFVSADEAIARVRAARLLRKLGTAVLCDASDVVGAGGTGQSTRLVGALLERATDLRVYAPLRDAAAVHRLWGEPEGARVDLSVGGHLGDVAGPALPVAGIVRARRELPAFGRTVALEVGHLHLVLTEAPPLVMKPSFYRALGLDPFKADITVVKSFFPFRIFFLAENRMTLYVRTEGITDVDAVRRLRFAGPVHPFDRIADWRSEDRRRRGVT